MKTKIAFFMIGMVFLSCVEEIKLDTQENFESALVIEATITDEFKQQKIVLSRTFRLEEEGPLPESLAMVRIVSADGDFIPFQEEEPGLYLSTTAFAAESNKDYHLEVTTSDGRLYNSSEMSLTNQTQIDNLYVERGINENDDEGISIFVDTFDPSGNSKYYRYEYEETYKIIAPLYSSLELVILNDNFPYPANTFDLSDLPGIIDFFVDLKQRDVQEQICYNSVKSNTIVIANTTELAEDRLDQFRIRFVNRNNFIISHRYSINVRQYVQSQEAHIFYETLRNFSEEGSLFSQIQSGFFEGNVFSTSNQLEKVIGYFEVSSVDERRLFFNYADLFPGEFLPPYYISCDDFFTPKLLVEDFFHNIIASPLIEALNQDMQFFAVTNDTDLNPFSVRPFTLVLEPCGDCTVLGENVVPDFWVD